jgi:hypothetical protein
MRIQDILYYAPGVKMELLLAFTSQQIIDVYKKRIDGYYLEPADILNREKKPFGAGDLCFDAIDAIARYQLKSKKVGYRFKKWISRLPDFNRLSWDELERVYDDFRNGVTHEARVKNGGQFTYGITKAVDIVDGVVLVNPKLLLEQVSGEFNKEIREIKNNEREAQRISEWIKEDLKEDLKRTGTADLLEN